jgi:hypothetical protein
MPDRNLVTLGGGTLYLDAIETGYLHGPVTWRYRRQGLRLPPSDNSLQAYDGVFYFDVDEQIVLKCSQAELSTAALRLALGIESGDLSTVTGSPSYNPASFTPASASTSYDVIRIGHNRINVDNYQTLLFEHTVPGSNKTAALILYRAFCLSKFDLVFGKRDIVISDCEWIGVVDNSRSQGDRLGMIMVQE